MEYKVNDIVVGWDHHGFSYHIKPWRIVKIDGNSLYAISRNWTYSKCVRKASIEEIEQYVKDNNCDINEILDICKNLYKDCNQFYSAYNTESIKTNSENIFQIDRDYAISLDNNFVYYKGKFARLVESQQEELPFKVGDKFTDTQDKKNIYTIINITSNKIKVNWPSDISGYQVSRKETEERFKSGRYKLIINQLKKEDFYNTKIDVSESPELSRLVQEKLFELGFKWASNGKTYFETKTLYITEDYSGTLYSNSDRKYKQIYPQDLGININNQTINNNNNVRNKENNSKENYSGRSIEVRRPTPTISTGQRRSGSSIQGKESKLRFTSGHLSHRARIGN